MKKSNKGFTMVELLAAIVIVGILAVFAVPLISRMVSTNRDQIYVNDARKLISLAEYKVKAASSILEKPDPGDCIVVSLVYLDDTDFDVAPNNGEYVKEASFVVIKNVEGKLEYSAAIVEDINGEGYRGIELTSGELLRASNATKYVTGISEDDLKKARDIDEEYINAKLGNDGKEYIHEIDNIYNEPELADSASKGGLESPIITKAAMSSTSGKDYNSLDATLTLIAEDKDTPKQQLKVCTSIVGYSECESNSGSYEAYGSKNTYKKEFDFSNKYDYESGTVINVYITVRDSDNNEDKTIIEYTLHKNEAPTIEMKDSGFFHLPTDKANRVDALFKLDVADDIDSITALKYCFNTDISSDNCDDYQSYNNFFDKGNLEKTYKFSNDKCELNGDVKKVKLFVKDTSGLITSQVFEYEIHTDNKPTFTYPDPVIVQSVAETFTNKGSLNVRLRVKGSDDVSYNDEMKVVISEANSETKEYNYDPNAEYDFKLGGSYDGKTRNINVQLKDECGHLSDPLVYPYEIYANKPPEFKTLEVSSRGTACIEGYECSGDGGNANVYVAFTLTDDIDYNNMATNVSACITQNADGCKQDSDYKPYSEYLTGADYRFTSSSSNVYDGTTKDLYVFAKDSLGAITRQKYEGGYKLYKNVPPTIKSFSIESKDEYFTSIGSLNVSVFLTAEDDLTEFEDMTYSVKSDGTEICHGNFANYDEVSGLECTVTGNYDGKTRQMTLEVKDSYGSVATKSDQYGVYENKAPEIYTVGEITDDEENEESEESETEIRYGADFAPQSTSCGQNYKCPYLEDNGGSADVNLIFNIRDDIDESPSLNDDNTYGTSPIKVCISENENYCNNTSHFQPYADFLNNGSKFSFNAGLEDPYDGLEHTVYVYAMDSNGKITHISEKYKLYSNQKPFFIYQKTDVNSGQVVTYPKISTTENRSFNNFSDDSEQNIESFNHIKKAKFEIEADDDFDEPNNLKVEVCYKLKGTANEICRNGKQQYAESYQVDFDVNKYSGQTFIVYAYVYDSLGNKSEASNSIEYTLYKDKKPTLQIVSATFEGGTVIQPEQPEEDDLTCTEKDGKYYNQEGEEVTEEEFNTVCNTATPEEPVEPEEKHSCEKVGNTYYNKNGDVVSEADFNDQCVGRVVGVWTDTSYDKVKISTIVQDPYDTYTICVNKTGEECPANQYFGKTPTEGFDGTSLDSGMVYYIEPQGITYSDGTNAIDDAYYVFIKDSNGNIAEVSNAMEEGEIPTEACVQNKHCAKVIANKYNECDEIEFNFYKAEFEIDTTRSTSSEAISAARCQGRCYYADSSDIGGEVEVDESERLYDTSGIRAYYKKKLFYKDKFNNNKSCDSEEKVLYGMYDSEVEGEPPVDYKLQDCSFHQCFKNPNKTTNQYQTKAIGLVKRVKPYNETVTYTDASGNFYESQEYYKVYISSYDGKSDEITLNPTNSVVIPEAYDAANSIFKFNANSNDFYVRIRD